MPFVLDVSIVGAWVFADENDVRADVALDLLARDVAIVPVQWWFEMRNMLIVGERRGRISESQTGELLDWLAKLKIQLAPLPVANDLFALARRQDLTFYDAAYLDLALRDGIALATLDRTLSAAAEREGAALISMS
jgi:predicted nucleic acid-binding protein